MKKYYKIKKKNKNICYNEKKNYIFAIKIIIF